MATFVPLVNGRSYDFTQITSTILGVPLPSISSVNYIQEQEKTNNFGTGVNPVSRGRGARDASGTFDISMNDVELLRAAVSAQVIGSFGSLLDIPPFDIVVVFGHPTNPTTHVLKNCEFTDDGVETSQGDTDVSRTFSLVMSHVVYNP
jgi:hypothetical protein